MNILYYLGPFPKLSKSFVLNEMYELRQKGHNIAVCALKKPEQEINHEEFDELTIPIDYLDDFSYVDITELFSSKALYPRILKDSITDFEPQRHIANLLRAKRCIEFVDSLDWDVDHFHSHFASAAKFGALYASEYYGVPFTITTHAYDLYQEPVGGYTSRLLQGADRIVTISEYNKRHIRRRFAQDTPVDIVRAGIRPEKFEPTELMEKARVLTVSRFVEKKGLEYAIEAVGSACEQIPELEYHIVGSGPRRSELKQRVERLGIDDTVSFLDNVSDEQLISEFDEARCFLLPCVVAEAGDRDGIPVVLMEAMAMKTPPISTTVSGIPELVDHEQNGLLTEPRNVEQTADAVVTLLKDNLRWRTYAEEARTKVSAEFNMVSEATKLERVFQMARTGATTI